MTNFTTYKIKPEASWTIDYLRSQGIDPDRLPESWHSIGFTAFFLV